MVLPDCAEIKIAERPHLSKDAFLRLTSLLATPLDVEDCDHDNLLQTAVDGCKGGQCAATTTSGSDDPTGRGRGADRRIDTKRTDRSHGPHSGGGLSSGRRQKE